MSKSHRNFSTGPRSHAGSQAFTSCIIKQPVGYYSLATLHIFIKEYPPIQYLL